MSGMSRRSFLKLGACAAGGVCAGEALSEAAASREAPDRPTITTVLPYPRLKLANSAQLKAGVEIRLTYPDNDSPISLLKLGKKAINGIGPDSDIVAYSRLCSHMGGALDFRPDTGAFHCPLHYARFDAAKGGLTVIGQATDNLPQIRLEVDGTGDIYAVGIMGLVYGRRANILG
ncbi:MAG: hypothetical protein OJF47_003522 [Nitrospira sp.]|jgi:arsenite oxidase small subunit|nr:MAG: hypothetical protein OJF47_003522 [Nitrospira sp.]